MFFFVCIVFALPKVFEEIFDTNETLPTYFSLVSSECFVQNISLKHSNISVADSCNLLNTPNKPQILKTY